MNQTYKSNIGARTSVILILALVISFGILWYFIYKFSNLTWFGVLLFGLVISYLIYLYINTEYRFTIDNKLDIRSGFKSISIDLNEVTSISETTGFHNTPNVYALSEQRINIMYEQSKYIEISPRNKERFIQEMKRINSSIIRDKEVNSATNKK